MPASRKKAKGKARKAAKAQQQQLAAAAASSQRGALHSQYQPDTTTTTTNGGNSPHHHNHNTAATTTNMLQKKKKKCQHGFGTESFSGWRICNSFMGPFMDAFNASGRHDDQDLRAAMDATYQRYTEVWMDESKLKWVISCFIANGTRYILDGTGEGGEDEYAIKDYAIIAYYLEEYVKVTFHSKTQQEKKKKKMDWNKICELQVRNHPSDHDLVKFYHERNPCKCLEKLYKEGEKALKENEKEREEGEEKSRVTNGNHPPNTNGGNNTTTTTSALVESVDELGLNKSHYDMLFMKSAKAQEQYQAVEAFWENRAGISPTQPSLN